MDLADEWSAESNDSFLQFGKANKTFLGFSVKALVINFVAKKNSIKILLILSVTFVKRSEEKEK